MDSQLVSIFILILVITITAFILWRYIISAQNLIADSARLFTGGFRSVEIETTTDRDKDTLEYIDDITGETRTFNLKSRLYKPRGSNEQIKMIATRGTIDEYARLIRLLGRFLPQSYHKEQLLDLLQKPDDTVYSEICKHFKRDPKAAEARAEHQATELYRILKTFLDKPVTNYLDYGCGDGAITTRLAHLMKAEHIYGVEADPNLNNSEINYHYVEPSTSEPFSLPYPDGHFEVITAFMSLHHVANPEAVVAELSRVLSPTGYLFIKEHDCWNAMDAMLVDIEHSIFAHCNNFEAGVDKELNDMGEGETYGYKNYYGWDKLMAGVGLNYISANYFYGSLRNEISPTRAYWSIYGKL